MAIIKCKMCGGDLVIEEGSSVAVCEYCGTKQTVPTADNEKKLTLFGRANRLLRDCEFDKAAGVFESIVAEFPEEAEAYWCLVLCRYGIEYVDDPVTGKKVPTCHRSGFESVMDDKDFENAMNFADIIARRVYRDEAKQIEELRKAIIEVSGKEEPYDIFISYKETDENGDRTLDSVIAQDIYKELTREGYRVFFSRISLEDKLGTEYEPYIFAALNSAKVMLCVGTDYEHFNAVWVKNEWSRFLSLIAKGEKKVLIPVFKNIDAYDMPKEFAKLSAQDMGKVGAMQDLLRGVEKIIGKKNAAPTPVVQTVVQSANGVTTDSLLKRGNLFLEDGDWKSADEYFDKVLDIAPENGNAYLGKLLAEMKLTDRTKLKEQVQPFDERALYKKAVRFGDAALIAELEGDNSFIRERNETARKTEIYNKAVASMKAAKNDQQFEEAAKVFDRIPGFKDADELIEECGRRAAEAKEQEKLRREREQQQQKIDMYESALRIMNTSTDADKLQSAARQFENLQGFRDSEKLKWECITKAANARKEKAYQEACAWPSDSISQNEIAIKKFRLVHEWKDSEEKIKERERLIADLEAKEEADRLEAERKAEERRIAAEKKKKKTIKTTAIVFSSAVVITGIVLLLTLLIIPNSKYNKAVSLMNGQKYDEAINAFEALSGYKDSVDQIKECKYILAVASLTNGEIIDAYESLSSLNGYKDSAEKASEIFERYKIEKLNIAEVGDIVFFGTYEQDNNTSNGKEDVEWIVLAKENGKALVISKYALDCQKYNSTSTDVTWENCSLRKWMNGTFLNNAFSVDEQAKIATTNVSADKNPEYSTNPGNATTDKVFLLSITEAEKYFTTAESRKCAPTAYAKSQGAWTSDNDKTASGEATCWWWLRSPGNFQCYAAGVINDGSVRYDGTYVGYAHGCVRPALWINLDSELFESEASWQVPPADREY